MGKQGDISSLADTDAHLYQLHAASIVSYVRARAASLLDAEDIVVESFMAAFQSEKFRQMSPTEQGMWLRRVAHNKITDYYRKSQRQPSVALDAVADDLTTELDSPEDIVMRHEEHTSLREAIALLSPLQQTLLRLRFAEGKRAAEIAATLGKSEDAIRKMLSRTLNQLRAMYAQK